MITNLDVGYDINLVTPQESQPYLSTPYFKPFIQASLFLASSKTFSIAGQQPKTLTRFLTPFFYTTSKQSKATCASSFLPQNQSAA